MAERPTHPEPPERVERLEAVRVLARLSRLLERNAGELGVPHYRVLAGVAAGHERASRLATRLALGKPTVSAAVNALCRRGLLERGSVAGDQRAVALHLTPAGETLLADVEAALLGRLEDVLARTPDPDAAVAALAAMGTALDQLADERLAR